jgi:hypothetical protein
VTIPVRPIVISPTVILNTEQSLASCTGLVYWVVAARWPRHEKKGRVDLGVGRAHFPLPVMKLPSSCFRTSVNATMGTEK